eukprot:CAMPEP_0175898942 /NCGR_PEP_ID=MMETSP0108-20121206/1521_1 /TAXON_ID=195067 ORGANISM="Goniomonas pacifica, Strain CCMP1869" /NCGR_SAMPLE_ID=MMETSP0108 /ASSEMBLY_ACC=CAM_ASM_000204 /LENGTH=259 /DNA_ID=CAMNT_0017220339 /DNA_START=29 /DNA_END=808 /DNA_ORIENTATION=-
MTSPLIQRRDPLEDVGIVHGYSNLLQNLAPDEESAPAQRPVRAGRRKWVKPGAAKPADRAPVEGIARGPVLHSLARAGRRRLGGGTTTATERQGGAGRGRAPLVNNRASFMQKAAMPMSPIQKELHKVRREVKAGLRDAKNLQESLKGDSLFLGLDHNLLAVFGDGDDNPGQIESDEEGYSGMGHQESRIPRVRPPKSAPSPNRSPLWPDGTENYYYSNARLSPGAKQAADRIRGLEFPLGSGQRDQLDDFLIDFLHRK